MNHETVEKNVGLLGVLIAVVISVGGLVEIVPLYFQASSDQPAPGHQAVRRRCGSQGRDIYVREGCYNCHSQMIRPLPRRDRALRATTRWPASRCTTIRSSAARSARARTSRASAAATRTTGTACTCTNPRDVVPESNMPGFPWLAKARSTAALTARKMRALRMVGVPYTDADIAGAAAAVEGKTELDALIAYLQGLGTNLKAGS